MIYIDSDGCIADFNKRAEDIGAMRYREDQNTFWGIIEEDTDFFYKLEELPDAVDSVWTILRKYGLANVQVLTALPLAKGNLITAHRNKVDWFKERFGVLQVNCVPSWRQKKNFIRTASDVLIDDHLRNCQDWESAGGVAIQHETWEDTMQKLDELKLGVK